MRTHLTRTIIALLAVAAQACSKSDNPRVQSQSGGEATVSPSTDSAKANNEALVRVVNAIPGSGAIDVYAGDQKFVKVDFKEATPYETLTENTPNFKVVRAGAHSARAGRGAPDLEPRPPGVLRRARRRRRPAG